MKQMNDSLYKVPRDKTEVVLKVLSNSARYKILALLSQGPMNISELSRAVKISQPTVTTYINQLEKAGLVFSRLQKSSTGYNKICQTAYPGITLFWQDSEKPATETEYEIEMPVGHYAGIDCSAPCYLATQAGIIASSEDFSRFYHPIRMEAEILVMGQGSINYLFPYNIPKIHKILYLELSLEMNVAFGPPDSFTEVVLMLNHHRLEPVRLMPQKVNENHHHRLSWYPDELSTSGQLCVWRVSESGSTLNSSPAGKVNLSDLDLHPMQPIEVALETHSSIDPVGGLIIFGKRFGQHNQDIRLTVAYEAG